MADEKKNNSAETPAAEVNSKKAESKKSKADKANDKGSKDKKPNIFVRMGKSIKKFCKDFKGECKKIVWPDRKTVLKSSGIVLVAVAVVGIIIFGIDTGLSELVKLLITAAENASADSETTTAAAVVSGSIFSGFLGA